ncbi:PDGLE domain-containing protein, partial [Micromonospora maritima]|uniref:PDGLE domain-containing protein n=1 Tax=Micromonospora maritima TaxID=986711 RepID=UPI001FEA0450
MSKRSWPFLLGGLLVALLLAGVVSNYASSHPDGLDSSLLKGCTVNADDEITGGSCPAQQARDHELADSPLARLGLLAARLRRPGHPPHRPDPLRLPAR